MSPSPFPHNSDVQLDDSPIQTIAEAVDGVLYLIDPAAPEVLYVSPSYEAVWGRSRERLYRQPRSFREPIHPHDRPRVESLRARQKAGKPAEVEYRLLGNDGSIRWMRDRSVPVPGDAGGADLAAGTVQDVTGERQAHRRVERRAALNALVASIALDLSQASSEEIDAEIYRALRRIGTFVDAADAQVYRLSRDGSSLHRTHRWTSADDAPLPHPAGELSASDPQTLESSSREDEPEEGTPEGEPDEGEADEGEADPAATISLGDYPSLARRLHRGDPLVLAAPADLPEGTPGRRLLADLQREALVSVPVLRDDRLTGLVALHPPDPGRVTPETIDVLRILGELVGSALERTARTEALRTSRDYFQRLVENGRDVVFEIDADGIVTYVSPSVFYATGYRASEITGRPLHDFLPPPETEEATDLLGHVGDVDVTDMEFRFYDRAGQTRYFRVSAQVGQEGDDEPRIFGIATDVTARKEAEIALRSEQAFTRKALDSLSGIFYVVGPTMRVRRWNRTLETTFALSPAEVKNSRFASFFPFSVRPEINDYLTQAFQGRPTQFEACITTDDGPVPYAFTASPVHVDGDRFVVGMGIDIRERIDAQRALADSFEALRQMHSVSVDEELCTHRKVDRLLHSAREYLGVECAVLSRIEDGDYQIQHAVGEDAPAPRTVLPFDATVCARIVERPRYEWPVTLPVTDAPLFDPDDASAEGADADAGKAEDAPASIRYTSMPVVIDGSIYGTLAFFEGNDDARWRLTGEQREYVKLLAQWVATELSQDAAKDEIQRSEQRFRELFEAAPDAYFVIDPDSARILDCNEAAGDLVGDDIDCLIGHSMDRLPCFRDLYPRDASADPPFWMRRVTKRGYARATDVTMERHEEGGGEVVVDLSASRVHLDGQPRILAVLRDVTRRKIAENELRTAVKQNEAFNEELQTLIEASTRLESRLDLDVVAQRIAEGAVDTVRAAEAASVWSFDDGCARLVASDGHGLDLSPGTGLSAPPPSAASSSIRVDLRDGVLHRVAEGGGLESVPHVIRDRATVAELDAEPLLSLRSLIAIPLRIDGTYRGALLLENHRRPDAFTARDLALARSLGAQANVALSNAFLVRELRATSHRLLQAQEDERQRLAQELHDETGGLLTSLQFKLQEVETQMFALDPASSAGHPPAALGALDEAREVASMLSALLRRVSRSLRPRLLDDLGLSAALSWLTGEFGEQSGLSISFSSEIQPGERYDPLVETAVFRIVQEALTNVARYADVDCAEVIVNRTENTLQVHVIDDGAGFDVSERLTTGNTLGLRGMIERAERLDGSVDVASSPGEGCRITAHIPTDASHDALG